MHGYKNGRHWPVSFYLLGLYTRLQQSKHADFEVCDSGLWIHPRHPLLAASLDAIAHCSCHSFRCVEIKCLFKCTTRDVSDLAENYRLFCLSQGENGLALKRNHGYYYQVQMHTQCVVEL